MIFFDANFLVSFYIKDENDYERALKIMGWSKNKIGKGAPKQSK